MREVWSSMLSEKNLMMNLTSLAVEKRRSKVAMVIKSLKKERTPKALRLLKMMRKRRKKMMRTMTGICQNMI